MTSEKWVPTDSNSRPGTALPSPDGGGNGWRLPSGQTLAEFALQSGFLAPQLLAGEAAVAGRQTPRGGANPSVAKEGR